MEATKEQKSIIDYIIDEMKRCSFNNHQQFRDIFSVIIGGYAGTGKTTLLSFLRKEIAKIYPKLSIAFVTYTGKASSVLKTKLDLQYIDTSNDYIGTIHGLIYKAKTVWDKGLKCFVIVGWELKGKEEFYHDLIIIDEASMVSKKIYDDLKKMGRSIISLGDHGQLPPIGDNFNLLKNMTFHLKNIHRQALNSPIIALSKFIREYGYIPSDRLFSKEVFKLSWRDKKCKHIWDNRTLFDNNLIVLCAFNATRVELNKRIRKKLDFTGELPIPGERVVCLNNDHKRGIMNGQIASIIWMMPEEQDLYRMTLEVDGYTDPIETIVAKKCFGQVTYTMYDKSAKTKKQNTYVTDKGLGTVGYFDFGYTMSVHKSQGSEWEKVILFEQRTQRWDDQYYARWLYTAVTRAKSKLFIISDFWG